MNYNQIPDYPETGKPTKFKDWIVKIVEEIQGIKGTPNHYDAPPISLLELSTKNIVREYVISSNMFQLDDDTGLYKYRLNHGLNTKDYFIELKDENNESITYGATITSNDILDIAVIENVNCVLSLMMISKEVE